MRFRLRTRALIARATFVALALLLARSPAEAEAPKRVVSMNVCTDQMAMMIAAEGQLHSVSYLAVDEGVSTMATEAGRYVVNHGLAEEIFLMRPDLVIAGTFSTRTTVGLLRRLGFRVEEFPPEASLDDVRTNMKRMGEILGREERAAELIAAFDSGVKAASERNVPRRSVAIYSANSYTSGAGSLVDAIVEAAGLENVAGRLGIAGTQQLPLEELVLSRPELIVIGDRQYGRPALAEQNFVHPAFRAIASPEALVPLPARLTICGGPFNVEAIRILQDAALASGTSH